MSDTVRRKRISGKKLTLIILGSFLAALILAVGIFYGVASCTSSKRVIPELKQGSTVRKAAPVDGSTPADHSGVDNVAYMAYVLDNQDYYHAYANNSTKSTGYEQVTQTWKDYKSAKVSGYGSSVMVCSDLSYSSLIKSASQTCFAGDKSAYMRTGNKPAKNTVPTEITWSEDQPTYFTAENYRAKYGEFSTELSVYVINDDTVEGFDGVIDNGDGTFTQKFYLKEDAAVWYRNGMKTRGSLKTLPSFERIEISFTFDSEWQVLSSYCEEKASISPSALGGIAMGSTSKTTTEFFYGEEELDGAHYSYFDKYYKNYVGKEPGGTTITNPEPTIIEVLGSAFNQVIDPNGNGQQFDIGLTLGETEYEGRAYAKVGNLDDIFGSLDIRLDLGRKDSGKQDLFIQFSNGAVKVYYSEEFALVADISRVAEEVTAITEWINNLKEGTKAEDVAYALSGEGGEGGLDLSALLAAIKFTPEATSARIAIDTDDLLGLGIGVKAEMNFTRTKAEDGDTFSFVNLNLGSLTYNNTPLDLGVSLLPGERTEIISHNKNDASASLADYIGGISGLLNSATYLVELNLDGTSEIEYISGVVLDATAKLKLENGYNLISVAVPLNVSYKGLSVNLEAFYTINLGNGGFGEVYLNLISISGKTVDARVYCNIEETVGAVKELINYFSGNAEVMLASETEETEESGETETVNTVANIINAVLNINYAKVVKELIANQTKISVTLDADEILSAFNFNLKEIALGDLTLTLLNGDKATLSGSLSGLGLEMTISGSDDPEDEVSLPDKDEDDYADLKAYVNGVYNLLNSNVILVQLNLDGTSEIEYISGVVLDAAAKLKLENGYNLITVEVPLTVSYDGLSVNLEAFYTINLENGGFGEIYLNVAEINGEPYGLKVYGNIEETVEAVKELITLINSDANGGNDEADGEEVQLLSEDGETEKVNTVANIINAVLNIDYASVIKELTANQSEISFTVDADEILGAFNFGLEEIGLGDLALTLNCGKKATVSGSLSGLGLEVNISGSDDPEDELTLPDKNGYIDVIELVDAVRAAYLEAQKIIGAKDTEFTIDATLTVDGVAMNVTGYGEASWIDGNVRFAACLELTIADTAKEQPNSETVHVNFVYDETEGAPIARFTVNELGLEIYQENIDEISNMFTDIMNAVKGLIGSGEQAAYYSEEAGEEAGEETVEPNEPAINYTRLLGTALNLISKITVELQEPAEKDGVKNLIINYAGNGCLKLGANGGLSLDLEISDDGNVEILSLNASVTAGDGTKIDAVNDEMDSVDDNGEKIYTFYTADKFVKAIYDYVLDILDGLTVKNLLGSNTYTVEVVINGSESGIDALDGITVNATLYYTETDDEGAKLIEADINLDIKGTAVTAKAYYTDRALYVSLENVGGTELVDVAFTAELDNIYGAAKTLVEFIKSETLAEIISIISGSQVQALSLEGTEESATEENTTESGTTSTSLTAVLNYILTLDINSVIKRENTDGKNVLTVNPDALLEALGADVRIGTVKVEVNPVTHTIYASVNNGYEWLTLNAVAIADSEHAMLVTDKFIDINFVSTLLEDLKATLKASQKDNGEILLSYAGEITAALEYPILGINANVNITFKNTVLTAGIDKDGDLYVTLTATLDTNKVNLGKLPISLGESLYATTAGNISITYGNGLIALGRDGVYKVMTLNYLLDNALAKNGSPIQWLLGMGDTIWSALCSNIPLDLSSGLTTPQTIELYELSKAEAEKGSFHLGSILNAFAYKLGGEAKGYKTDAMSTAAEKLGLTDDYYAFDVNGNLLTNGTVSTLYAAILRDGNGIKGIKAFANIAGYVDLTVTLDNRAETDNANLYKEVKESEGINLNYFDGAEKDEVNHTTPVFGCYDMTKNGDERYIASQMLDIVTLTVYDENGKADEYDLSYGSTVYLTNTFAPDWANEDKTRTFIYKNSSHEEITDESIVITADTVIYKAVGETPKKEIIYHTNIAGLEEISAALTVSNGLVKLEKYQVDGYWLEGWYSDEAHSYAVSEGDALSYGGNHVYCVYLKETVTVNGVIYTFMEAEQAYHVTGFDGASILPYTEESSVLVLENNIGEYAITSIDEKAFEKANIKNIIVPENITRIASLAFLDNIGMRSAVFLAPEITFEGQVSSKSEGGYAFYGCTEEEGGERTILNVYYNTVLNVTYDKEGIPEWAHVRAVSSSKHRYIGHNGGSKGSSLNGNDYYEYSINDGNRVKGASKNWAYVNFEIVAENNVNSVNVSKTEFANLINGINTAAMTKEEIETYVLGVLNGLTQSDGYINAFTVSATGGIELNGKMYTVTITVTEKPEEEWTRDTNVSVTLISEIAFGIDGANLETNGSEYVLSITASDLIPNAVPADSSVTFLGWAKLNADGTLEFTEARANANSTYYAIWANNTDGAAFTVNTSGTMPAVTVTAGNKELDKWVDANGNEVTRITPDTTVLSVSLKDTGSGGCVATGTLITLADGSQKAVEELEVGEMVLVWNFYTGAYDVAPVMYIDSDPDAEYEIINLCFSDGTQVKVIDKHGFWDFDLNRYIYLDRYASQYIGHWFNKQVNGGNEWIKVQLTDVIITTEYTGSWSPVTYRHLNYYVNGMLCVPGNNEPFIYIFDVDSETMKYDEQAMADDIETYGLYTYEEFYELMPVSEEVFNAYNGQYMKVALGKGLTDLESLQALAEIYKDLTDSL